MANVRVFFYDDKQNVIGDYTIAGTTMLTVPDDAEYVRVFTSG